VCLRSPATYRCRSVWSLGIDELRGPLRAEGSIFAGSVGHPGKLTYGRGRVFGSVDPVKRLSADETFFLGI
jgi:hypothetical protein